MKRYSAFHALLYSFFSRPFYGDVARQWKGTNLRYLFLLNIFLWVVFTMQIHGEFQAWVDSRSGAVPRNFEWAIYAALMAGSYALEVLATLALAVIGLVISRLLRVIPTFQTLLRLAVVALTPALVLAALFMNFFLTRPKFWGGIALALTLVYMTFGIWAGREASSGE